MEDRETKITETKDEVGQFAEAYSSFNNVINGLNRQYLSLKQTYARQSEELQQINQALQRTAAENRRVTEFLDNILSSIPSGVIVIDADGRVALINAAARQILGLTKAEIGPLRARYEDLILSETNGHFSAPETMRSGRPLENVEKKVRRRDGRLLTLSVSTSLLKNPAEETTGAVELIQDISRLRHLEEEISRMKILASLGEMAASVAHEIRSPLSGVGGFASLLIRDLENDPHKREMAEKIVSGVTTINQIIETLLAFARNEEINRSDIVLGDYLREMVAQYADECGCPECRDRITVACPEKFSLHLDPQLFRQALFNLIRNGLEAGGEAGAVRIDCFTNRVSTETDSGREEAVIIEIEDRGAGIPAEERDRIFSPFYSTKRNGTGLGLSIAWKIIRAHGGELRAESQVGRGTKFIIQLPMEQ